MKTKSIFSVFIFGVIALVCFMCAPIKGGLLLNSIVASTGVVTSGLVLHLDAAKFNGTSFPGTGCGSLVWKDLTANVNDATLVNCSAGLQGDGSNTSPYRVDFDGLNDYATIPSPSGDTLDLVEGENITICALHNPVLNGDTNLYHQVIANRSGGSSLWEFILQNGNGAGSVNCGTFVGASPTWYSSGVGYALCNANSVISKNAWHFTCIASEHGGVNSTIRYYQEGTADGTDTYPSANRAGNAAWAVTIGTYDGVGETYVGDMAWIGVYDRVLTEAEVVLNCNSLKTRVTGLVCPP